jgi:multidrug transporter EmrE-like cation transporter
LSYGVVAILSIFLLDEKMNALKWVGIACIIAGVSLIGIA